MYPGSFFWNRVSDKWLKSRTASLLFAISTVVILAMTAIWFDYVHLSEDVFIQNLFLAVAGVLSVASIVFLWGGMWSYWLKCDDSKRILRKITFVFLLLGFWYGAIVYYLVVYLPAVRREIHISTARGIL
jgi:hypothetical protein